MHYKIVFQSRGKKPNFINNSKIFGKVINLFHFISPSRLRCKEVIDKKIKIQKRIDFVKNEKKLEKQKKNRTHSDT